MGRGSSGNVSCATWKDTTRIFALKSFNNDKQTHKEIVKEIAEESSGAKKVFVVIPYIDPKSLMDQQYKLDKKSDIL
ncbi:kinase-like domain-containing protein [Rhizophagus clarus]|uniref:Kinase-like domain-containing protein n=1 Tax=Rhizophagus clarus TaxID=94130 RepID=A0A8H3MJI0_9GLOM|nr:kinase-like domain-containing protein [Rhizophagus clarus]